MDQHAPQPMQYQPRPAQTSGRAIASMVLGICSIVTCPAYGVPGLVCGILAIIFAKKAEAGIADGSAPETSRGMLKAGRACGWVGLSLSILMVILVVVYLVIIIGVVVAGAAGAASGGNGPTILPF